MTGLGDGEAMDRGSHSSRTISPEEWESAVYRLRLHLYYSVGTTWGVNVHRSKSECWNVCLLFRIQTGRPCMIGTGAWALRPYTLFFPRGKTSSRQMHIRIGCLLGRASALLPRTWCQRGNWRSWQLLTILISLISPPHYHQNPSDIVEISEGKLGAWSPADKANFVSPRDITFRELAGDKGPSPPNLVQIPPTLLRAPSCLLHGQ